MKEQKEKTEKENVESVVSETVPATTESNSPMKQAAGTEVMNISDDMFLTKDQLDWLLANDETIDEDLTATYLKGKDMKIGEEFKAVIVGWKTIPGMNGKGEVPAVRLYAIRANGEKQMILTAASIVVSECKQLPVNSTIRVRYDGKKDAKVGQLDVFTVKRIHHLQK